MIWIITGTLIITALLAAGFYGMVSVNGWKATLQIWAVSALVTAIATGGALLIGYGVERL